MGHILENARECTGCGACVSACPCHAISMKMYEVFFYPHIDRKKCIDCGICKNVCQMATVKEGIDYKNVVCYAGAAQDVELRNGSSSGGIFGACAEAVLAEDGEVCGAIYDETLKVKHKLTGSKDELEKMRGSKYVQSDMQEIYLLIRDRLESGKTVLFSGCPCQTHGLRGFLKNTNQENLICIDVICHGVPSPVMWEKYIEYVENKNGKKVTEINMRDKTKGWRSFSFSFSDGTKKLMNANDTLYMKCFTSDICLRECCYDCQYKDSLKSHADLMIGDFWGIEKFDKEYSDTDESVSLIFAVTEKGKKLLEKADIYLKKVESEKVDNPGLHKKNLQMRHAIKPVFLESLERNSIFEAYKKINVRLFFAKVWGKLGLIK